jgi:tetratricopeptide (TPR) repeat protein
MRPADQILALRRAGDHEQACVLAVELATASPGDADLQYETACVHDYLGREARAIPFYTAALGGDLSVEKRRRAYLGLSSTYRALGRYAEAERTAREGLARFPDAVELSAFLAMALHNLGQSKRAVEILLTLLAQTSSDPQVEYYREAILFYAQDIERSWPDAV